MRDPRGDGDGAENTALSGKVDGEPHNLQFQHKDKTHSIPLVKKLKVIGSLLTSEADTMSAMKFRMNKADKVSMSELHTNNSRGVPEKKKHDVGKQRPRWEGGLDKTACKQHFPETVRQQCWIQISG